MNGVTRIFDLLQLAGQRYKSGHPVLYGKKNGVTYSINAETYQLNSFSIGQALLDSGINRGDRVATIINNRPEWNFLDMAIGLIGAVQVPVYPTLSEDQIRYIFKDAAISGLIVNDILIFNRIKNLAAETASIKIILSVDPVPGLKSIEYILNKYRPGFPHRDVQEIADQISPAELFAIIYTSGTTGRPKGVMLSHSNIVSNFISLTGILNQQPVSLAASVLPLCHIYERILNYTYQNTGTSIWYIDGFDRLRENLAEARPEMFCAVPRLLEKLFDTIMAKGRDLKGIKRFLFFRALAIGQQYEPYADFSLFYRIQLAIYRRLVFNKWKKALGGKLISIVSGGASLNPKLTRIFWAAGFKLMEGYGLTETSPVIAVSNFLKGGSRTGTVGPVLPGVELKFAADGEILVRGPNVMMGYYNRPERTAEVFDDEGWFHTGDIGQMIDGKYVQITDRKKEIFKTSGGKYIAPQVLENQLKESAFIEQVIVIG
jgi:long-chain acyl-CoA synthetase